MANCSVEDIQDLKGLLLDPEGLDGIKTKRFGVYYLKSKAFLHFHSKNGERWADVRDGLDWGTELSIPFKASRKVKDIFFKKVKVRYERTICKKV